MSLISPLPPLLLLLPPSPQKAIQKDKAWGKWERHTKGFGLKMLKKMGFEGALGKTGSEGISRPVQVQVRPRGAGLGSVQEATHLNKHIEEEYRPEAAAKAGKEGEGEPGWKKEDGGAAGAEGGAGAGAGGGAGAGAGRRQQQHQGRRVRKRYKTWAEVLQEEGSVAPAKKKQVVIDMRGKRGPRVASNFERLLKGEQSSDDDDAHSGAGSGDDDGGGRVAVRRKQPHETIGKELLHNVRTLADMAEVELVRASRKYENSRNHIAATSHDLEVVTHKIDEAKQELTQVHSSRFTACAQVLTTLTPVAAGARD